MRFKNLRLQIENMNLDLFLFYLLIKKGYDLEERLGKETAYSIQSKRLIGILGVLFLHFPSFLKKEYSILEGYSQVDLEEYE